MESGQKYFQDHMPGNVCFGCGVDNPDGLHIKSYWDGEVSVATWHSAEKYHGWPNLLNGGILASLVDCHAMCTAMAYAVKLESRALGTEPEYRYATGTLSIRYLKPTSNNHPIELRAHIKEVKGRKTVLRVEVFSQEEQTAEAEVIAIRVFDSSQPANNNPFSD